MGWTAASVGIAAVAGAMTWATRGRTSSVFCPSRWRGDPHRKTIALTFDDGPSESTPELLRVLDEYGVRATFFQCGAHARRLPEIARAVAARHEIGNHTETHPRLWLRSPEFLHDEIARAQESLAEITGQTSKWFRSPYGVRWPGLGAALAPHSLTNVMWTVLSRDWVLPARQISGRILHHAGSGGILCFHDGREMRQRPDISATIDAVRLLVPALLEDGYAFETVSEILCPTN